MTPELAESYAWCREVARSQARNFYYAFTVLPPEKKAAMCAIYAFMRFSDDITDDENDTDRHARLARWRQALDDALQGRYGDSRILPAFHDTVRRYGIPGRFFHALIDGAEMDLVPRRYETFEELRRYCYHVASVVGIVCIHVWGFTGGEAALAPAEDCGIAFQLTNILRDLKEDGERGRVYLPREDLRRFGCSEADLLAGVVDDRFRALMKFQVDRAREFYRRGAALLPHLSPDGRSTFTVMYRIYRGVLDRIEAQGYDVFASRAQLSVARKAGIVARVWLGSHVPALARAGGV